MDRFLESFFYFLTVTVGIIIGLPLAGIILVVIYMIIMELVTK